VTHPAQLLQPGRAAASDTDPVEANATRSAWLERITREGRTVAPAHFAEPFGTIVRPGDVRWGGPRPRWRRPGPRSRERPLSGAALASGSTTPPNPRPLSGAALASGST